MNREEVMAMTEEQRMDKLLNSMSDSVKEHAHHLSMLKAIAHEEAQISPEDFDDALKREMDKEWEKLKDLNGVQLALVAAADLMKNGHSLEFLEKGED